MKRFNQRDTSHPLRGAAYIRYSSEMQNDSFSLDAQLRQIKEQAERDGVEIIRVYSDPATSAYRKKYRPGINAMREGARRREFDVLYVHKVDRLARRLEWSLEIVHELQSLDISFKAVEQPFDLSTPEGKLLFHLVSSLGEFYSATTLARKQTRASWNAQRKATIMAQFPGDISANFREIVSWECPIQRRLLW